MGGFSEHKRSIGVVLLLLLLVGAFSGWVVTSPEFGDGSDGRSLVTRISEATTSRVTAIFDGFRGKRKTAKSGPSAKAQSAAAKEITGPAAVIVLDTRSRPVSDVTVVFRADKGKSISAKTNSRGRVDARLPVGEYQVAMSHPKYSSMLREGQMVRGPDKGFSLAVTLESRVTVKGTVLDEENRPLAGVKVSGRRSWLQRFAGTGSVFLDDAAYPTVETDARGAFELSEISIGSNTFSAAKSGYGPVETKVEIPAGGLTKEFKITLKRPSQLSGRIVDEQQKPVPGVKITALQYQPYGGEAIDLPTTGSVTGSNAQGVFKLSKLYSDGYYLLRFEQANYAVLDVGNVVAGTSNLQITMQRGGEISGRVQYLDRPSTGARVLIQARGVIGGTTITRSIMTQGSGDYKFDRLPYGSYELLVDYDGFINEPRGRVTSLKDKPTTGALVEIYQRAILSGKVLDAFSGEAIPESPIVVRASYGYDRQRVRAIQARADANGAFLLDTLPGGTHVITARAEGYLPTSGNPADYTIPIEPGGRLENYEVYLSKGGIIKGQVISAEGQGIGECQVQLYVASGSFNNLNVKDMAATTDGGGYFQFSGFPIGQRLSVYVSARKEGYAKNHSELVELTPQQPEMLTQVILTQGGVVSGRVTDESDVPLYGVKVTFDSREFYGDPSPSEFYTFTDANGNYLLERCSVGRAILVADREDCVRQTKGINVPEDRLLSKQNFKLKRSNSIRGVVADFQGNPIADARVTAAPKAKATGNGRSVTNKKGEYEIQGLSEGTFRLEANFSLKTPDGQQAYTFLVPEAQSGSNGIPIDCDLAPTALGRVTGDLGKAVDNFAITLRSRLDTNPAQLFRFNLERKYTNAGGFFRLLKVPRGLYKLKVEAAGFETWESDEIEIGPGNRTNLPAIRLKAAAGLLGTIVSGTTGKPVQGALVRVLDDSRKESEAVNRVELQGYNRSDILELLSAAYDSDSKYDPDPMTRLVARVRANVVTTRQTNVYGKFNVDDLGPGMYTLEFEHPSYRPLRMRNIKVGRDKATDIGNVELRPGGIVQGRVIDLEGNGISNAQVEIRGEMQGRSRAHTDTAGTFIMRGIENGEWPVSVKATLNGRQVYAWKRVSVRPDETTQVEFILDTSASVTGQVAVPGGTVRSGSVRLYYIDDAGAVMDDIVYQGNVAAGGRFVINGIPAGRYFAVVTGQGNRGPFAFWTWLDLNRGRNTPTLAVVNASLAGTANNVSGGAPVPGSNVQVTLDVPGVIVPGNIQNLLRLGRVTDGAGRFVFPYLQPGTYRIWAGGPAQQIIPVDALSVGAGAAITGYKVVVQGG